MMSRETEVLEILKDQAGFISKSEKKPHYTKYPYDRNGKSETGYEIFFTKLYWTDGSLVYVKNTEQYENEDMRAFEISLFDNELLPKLLLSKLNGKTLCRVKDNLPIEKAGFHPFDRKKYLAQFEEVFQVPKFKTMAELELRLSIKQ